MSGSLRLVGEGTAPTKHEHFDLTVGVDYRDSSTLAPKSLAAQAAAPKAPKSKAQELSASGKKTLHLNPGGQAATIPASRNKTALARNTLRLNDPRRFGAVLWHPAGAGPLLSHPLLAGLGVEPLTPAFTPELLFRATRGRKASIKQALLAGDIVVGVGNIYASESLFRARIRPTTAAGRVSLARFEKLVPEIRAVLRAAIAKGGSTLRDFHSNGESGYFQLDYFVYDREGQNCKVCGTPIRRIVQGQRSTFYCPACQR
jgi:DNA-formamidopyrimidine glycosylase